MLSVFNQVSLDGFITDAKGDMSWAHRRGDAEWDAFGADNAKRGSALLFGRVTYEMMASFWPTPQAMQTSPGIAEPINRAPKFVLSRTMKEASWQNTKLLKGDLVTEVKRLKSESGKDITIMGSGSIVSQLTEAGLIDEYHVVVVPVVLGRGKTMFQTVHEKVPLKLVKTRTFGNGNVMLSYESITNG